MGAKGCVKALGRVMMKALRELSPRSVVRGIDEVADDYASVAELILMLPAPRKTTIANIVYRLVYNLVRALLMLPLIMPLLPVILLALQYCNMPFLGGAAA